MTQKKPFCIIFFFLPAPKKVFATYQKAGNTDFMCKTLKPETATRYLETSNQPPETGTG